MVGFKLDSLQNAGSLTKVFISNTRHLLYGASARQKSTLMDIDALPTDSGSPLCPEPYTVLRGLGDCDWDSWSRWSLNHNSFLYHTYAALLHNSLAVHNNIYLFIMQSCVTKVGSFLKNNISIKH